MAQLLPPPPINDKPGSFTWLEWYRQLRAYVTTTGNVPWYIIDFTGSDLNDIAVRNHNQLQSLQGGMANEFYHLTSAEYTALSTPVAHNSTTGLQGGAVGEYYHLDSPDYTNLTGGTPTFDSVYLNDYLVIDKASDKGIKVDITTPTYPWQDLTGEITVRTIGSNDPSYSSYVGNIYQYEFTNGTKEVFNTYHVPHDYVEGSELYIHVHWSQTSVDTGGPAGVPGNIKWYFDISYAKGHQQAAFSTPITTSIVQQASGTAYTHNIAEVVFTSSGGSSTTLDTDDIEPDGLILVRTYRNSADAADTLNVNPWGHYVDIHYQSTGIGTKQKAPNFYV